MGLSICFFVSKWMFLMVILDFNILSLLILLLLVNFLYISFVLIGEKLEVFCGKFVRLI